jgi:hypothetical protein
MQSNIQQKVLVLKPSLSKNYIAKQEKIDKRNANFIRIIKTGNIKLIKDLLENDLYSFRSNNEFCLYFCASHGFYHLVKILVKYGYLRQEKLYKENNRIYPPYNELFKQSLEWAAKNGHVKILKFLYKYTGSEANEFLSKIILRNFNIMTDYSKLLEQNEKLIEKSNDIIKKTDKFNKDFNRNKMINISVFDEMLVNANNENENRIGLDYNEDYASSGNESNCENENETGNESDKSCNSDKEMIIESDSENEFELQEDYPKLIKKNENKIKNYKSNFFRLYKNKSMLVYKDGIKSKKKSPTLLVILWLISKEIIVNTDYQFISNYASNHKLIKIINILKKHNKFMIDISSQFDLMDIDDKIEVDTELIEDNLFGDSDSGSDNEIY